ncbi:TSUP family transporter [Kocuria sp.]|uniref:TSUP family transporter n=1 Tax=Kocuria sp. TaxID=1871328 RepID=UPI0026DCE410|nr:TSUP family transporter [Kocuria sp.]MDO4919568.1 TSUP family transporter [Kocuria sp.]
MALPLLAGSGLESAAPELVVLLVVTGLAAGFVDAVVGGGGLLQLPVTLMIPGLSPVQALATNKMGSVFGTATSALTFYRRVRPDLRTALPMAAVAFLAAGLGAALAAALPAAVFKPVIVLALVAVLLFTVLKPSMGRATALRHAGSRHYALAVALGAVIGCYDGVMGPGTGSFLVIGLVSLLGYSFLAASAKAKIVNLATNLGALVVFTAHGSVLWGLGLVLGLSNMAGGYLGARTAVARGSSFIRAVFFVVVAVLIVKLGWDVLAGR